jgi:hypothetical protein
MLDRTSTRNLGRILGPIALATILAAGCKNESAKEQAKAPEQVQPEQQPVAQEQPVVTPAPTQAPVEQPVAVQAPAPAQTRTSRPKTVTPKAPVEPKKEDTSPEPVSVAPAPAVLAVGTALSGSLQSTLSTEKSQVGEAVNLRVTEPVVVEGRTVVPVGSIVHGTVTHVRSAGRMHGAAELTVRFTELELASGERHPVTCEPFRRVVKGDGKETAATIGGGAAAGGILGGVLGGGDGALKGGAIGAAVGTGVAVATKGEQIVIPAGQSLKVTLTVPITLTGTNS